MLIIIIKSLQILNLCSISLHQNSFICYLLTILLNIISLGPFYLTAGVAVICSLYSLIITFNFVSIVSSVLNVILIAINYKMRAKQNYDQTYSFLISPFLIFFSLTTIISNIALRNFQTTFFCLFLIVLSLTNKNHRQILLKLSWLVLIIEAVLVGIYRFEKLEGIKFIINESWWFYISFCLSILYSTFSIGFMKKKPSMVQPQNQIELKQMIGSKSQNLEFETEKEKEKQYDQGRNWQQKDQIQQRLLQDQKIHEIKSESNSFFNLMLLIPFLLLGKSIFQLPVYIYIFALGWNRQNRILFLVNQICISCITIASYSQLNLTHNILLRILMILIVNKSLTKIFQLRDIIQRIWLRSCFVIVLAVTFWFSLLTVNVFHLIFLTTIMLFISKGSEEYAVSFRHRNWHYLLCLFNVFLFLRQCYLVFFYEPTTKYGVPSALELFGISFHYNQGRQLFNLIPLLINSIIGLQYLTYTSQIYHHKSKQQILGIYKAIAMKIIRLLTILYYKMLPWASYFVVMGIVLLIDYSFSTSLILLCILVTFARHISLKNKIESYRKLQFWWKTILRLIAFQTILCYIFQFFRFSFIHDFVIQVRVLKFLIQFQQITGWSFRNSNSMYFRTITKFQLMMSLNLASIFISFLVVSYYQVLIQYQTLQKSQKTHFSSRQEKIIEQYNEFIDFKIIDFIESFKINRIIRIACIVYSQAFYILIGIISCLEYSGIMFFYLTICINYFLKVNLGYYHLYFTNGIGAQIEDIVVKWKQNHSITSSLNTTQNHLSQISKTLMQQKLKQRSSSRFYLLIVTILLIMLNYSSFLLHTEQIANIFDYQNILYWKWILFVLGCGYQIQFSYNLSIILLLLVVIEMKACWFLGKFMSLSGKTEQDIVRNIINNQDEQNSSEHQRSNKMRQTEQYEMLPRGKTFDSSLNSQIIPLKQNKEYLSMQISLAQGSIKLIERGFVMLLVLASLVQSQHPFGVVYLVCAVLLNYVGGLSIKGLSWVLTILVVLEYACLLGNYSNEELVSVPEQFAFFQQQTLLHMLFNLPISWERYLTFGKSKRQIIIVPLSFAVICLCQVYFVAMKFIWLKIMSILQKNLALTKIEKRIYTHFTQVYNYALMYCPLFLTILCLGIYFLDYTLTNLILSFLSLLFLFVSFLMRDYAQSRQFWHIYFMVLQFMIVLFMILYTLLQIPMFNGFCSRILCSSEEFHTQIYKAILLFILQLGIDLMRGKHFQTAMQSLRKDKGKADYFKLSIAFKNNDKKIMKQYKQLQKDQNLNNQIIEIQHYLQTLKQKPTLTFSNSKQQYRGNESWMDLILQFLPSLIDSSLILTVYQAKKVVKELNWRWIKQMEYSQSDLIKINQTYMDQFGEIKDYEQLKQRLVSINTKQNAMNEEQIQVQEKFRFNNDIEEGQEQQERQINSRISFIQQKLPYDPPTMYQGLQQKAGSDQKTQLLYLLMIQSILSNWHYLTYGLLVLQHMNNMGILTLPLIIITFFFGIVNSYQAAGWVWRLIFLSSCLPVVFKFAINVGIFEVQTDVVFILIGDNSQDILLEFLVIGFVIGQCIILKIIGHYEQETQQIECMKIALIRNIINHRMDQEITPLYTLLSSSKEIPSSHSEFLFLQSQQKPGYDYSSIQIGLQITLILYTFLFYDEMATSKESTIYQKISYNQFNSGMVIILLVQVVLMIMERIVAIVQVKNSRWQVCLVAKYFLMFLNVTFVEILVIWIFPHTSQRLINNSYVTFFYFMQALCFLFSALQIKAGFNTKSKGLMDRYTWYNGFVYIAYRAIPFLFEFKAFFDWTFTKTSLRLFDWIRMEQIFGRLYVAKCNSLFMMGKVMGDKIQWWKKLLMGYPLLIAIIMLLFGPLVLFSNLNPLASLNQVAGGHLELLLKINETNKYLLYQNSHVRNILPLKATSQEDQLFRQFDVDAQTVQTIQFDQFSDEYWQISEGSYQRLLGLDEKTSYDIQIRVKFIRNLTGDSSVYKLSTFRVPLSEVQLFKSCLQGKTNYTINNFIHQYIRLDNNNGIHFLGDSQQSLTFYVKSAEKSSKKYWIIADGLSLKVASDHYTEVIFGYSVMGFYVSIILVIANYLRFLFQGSVHTIIFNDIPYADPMLKICDGIYKARVDHDIIRQEWLFWTLVDLLRSPDSMKGLTGCYLNARMQTIQKKSN